MDISALIQSTVSPQSKHIPPDLSNLKSGFKLSGRVIQTDPNGTALIDFGNFRAATKMAIPVQKGQVLDFVIEKKDGQLAVKIVPTESQEPPPSRVSNTTQTDIPIRTAVSNKSLQQNQEWQIQKELPAQKFEIIPDKVYKALLTDIEKLLTQNASQPPVKKIPSTIQQSLQQITTYFKPLPTGNDLTSQISQLKTFIEDSGIFFEKKIEEAITQLTRATQTSGSSDTRVPLDIKQVVAKDLKPHLLILKNYFADPEVAGKLIDPKGVQRVQQTVDQILLNVSQQQEVAINRPNDPDLLQVFSYTIPLQEEDQKSRIKIYYPKKKVGQNKGSHRVSLLLDMDRLGTVRADLVPVNTDLNITFYVKNDSSRQLVESNFEELLESLATTYNHFYITATVSDQKIDRFETEDGTDTSNKQIDIKA